MFDSREQCGYCGRMGGFHEQQCDAPVMSKPTDVPESTKHECILYRHTSSDPTAAGMHVESYLKCEECGAIYDDEDDAVVRRPRNVPPAGWICTRDSGHYGPCAAIASNPTPAASPVAGGSARIAEIASRLAAISDWKWDYAEISGTRGCYRIPKANVAEVEHIDDGIDGHTVTGPTRDFIAAAPDDIAYLLKLVPEGWVKVTPETKAQEFYIVTTAHEALWPRGVLLFWAANRSGYATFLEQAGRYSEEEARSICRMRGGADFMVPCEVIEAEAIRVVDVDKLKQFTPAAEEERSSL